MTRGNRNGWSTGRKARSYPAVACASWILFAGTAAARAEDVLLAQAARTCKQVSSCEEAVVLWCSGYRRADGDGDGIPCENVCRTKAEVDRIRAAIGC